MSIKGSCHCGAISYEFNDQPEWATECNCSICRRLGSLWIYSDTKNIKLNAESGALLQYSHGSKELVFHSCKHCGCTSHWQSASDPNAGRMAVNLRLAELSVIESIPKKQFDGADTWEFLD